MNDSIAHELKRENRLSVARSPQSHGELFSRRGACRGPQAFVGHFATLSSSVPSCGDFEPLAIGPSDNYLFGLEAQPRGS